MICEECKDKGFVRQPDGTSKRCSSCNTNSFLLQHLGLKRSLSRFDISKVDKQIRGGVDHYIKTFSLESPSLYLVGTNNTGKTLLALHILAEVEKKGHTCLFLTFAEMVRMAQEYSHEMLEAYKQCDLLLIDDSFDTQKAVMYKSRYQVSFIDEFLRVRIELRAKPTIFTSNSQIQSISTNYSTDLFYLMSRNTMQVVVEKQFETNKTMLTLFSDVAQAFGVDN